MSGAFAEQPDQAFRAAEVARPHAPANECSSGFEGVDLVLGDDLARLGDVFIGERLVGVEIERPFVAAQGERVGFMRGESIEFAE